MHPFEDYVRYETRRQFLSRGASFIGTAALAALAPKLVTSASANESSAAAMQALTHFAPKAKHIIYLHMVGGPPQMDLGVASLPDMARPVWPYPATAALTPGADLRAVDAAARDVIDDAGHGEHYVHGLGHGVGLQIHEAPGIGKLAAGTLPCGAAVTVEPGVYLPGWGGVRIEDTLVVTDGDPDLLTATDKTFTVI